MDALVTGVKIQFERYKDESLLLQGSIETIRAWDPDMSNTTSDRNRHLLGLTEDIDGNRQSDPFFSFQYRTFRTLHNKDDGHFCLPDWVENRISSGDIDDFLTIKMKPLEFNYLHERNAELADYLNNGLPGELSASLRNVISIKSLSLLLACRFLLLKERAWGQHPKWHRVSVKKE